MNFSTLIQIINEELQTIAEFWDDDQPHDWINKYHQGKGLMVEPQKVADTSNGQLYGYLTIKYGGGKYEPPVAIYRNPKSLMNFPLVARGILTANGDVYVALTTEGLHYDMLQLLSSNGVLPQNSVTLDYGKQMPNEYIAVLRFGKNRFVQSTSYSDFPPEYDEMFNLANKTRSPLSFVKVPYF